MLHKTVPDFWHCYKELPNAIQKLATKNFELLKDSPSHPSLRFKKVGQYWSVRIGIAYRAVAYKDGDNYVWFWIGHHNEYDELI